MRDAHATQLFGVIAALQQIPLLGALGLVLNAVVLWNTFYMDLAVKQLRTDGYPVHDEDVARLSPLGFKHIHFLGRYAFNPSSGHLEIRS